MKHSRGFETTKMVLGFLIAAGLAAVSTMAGCSLKPIDKKYIRVEIPQTLPSSHRMQAQMQVMTGYGNFEPTPTQLSDFTCLAINVTGPGIPQDGRVACYKPEDEIGSVGGTIYASNGGVIDLQVLAGPSRKVQLLGFMTTDGQCPLMDDVFNAFVESPLSAYYIRGQLGKPYLLGESVIDLYDDQEVEIAASYDPMQPRSTLTSCGANESTPWMSSTPEVSVAVSTVYRGYLSDVASNSAYTTYSMFESLPTASHDGSEINGYQLPEVDVRILDSLANVVPGSYPSTPLSGDALIQFAGMSSYTQRSVMQLQWDLSSIPNYLSYPYIRLEIQAAGGGLYAPTFQYGSGIRAAVASSGSDWNISPLFEAPMGSSHMSWNAIELVYPTSTIILDTSGKPMVIANVESNYFGTSSNVSSLYIKYAKLVLTYDPINSGHLQSASGFRYVQDVGPTNNYPVGQCVPVSLSIWNQKWVLSSLPVAVPLFISPNPFVSGLEMYDSTDCSGAPATMLSRSVPAGTTNVTFSVRSTTVTGGVTFDLNTPGFEISGLYLNFYGLGGSAPFIDSISPNSGPISGGGWVTVNGLNFDADAVLYFGANECVSRSVYSTKIDCTLTPAAASSGWVDVTVVNLSSGTSYTFYSGYNYYVPAVVPNISALSSTQGSVFGGNTVMISGDNFEDGAVALFGGLPCGSTIFYSSMSLSCVGVPSVSSSKTVDVMVVNPSSHTSQAGVTYFYEINTKFNVILTPTNLTAGDCATLMIQYFDYSNNLVTAPVDLPIQLVSTEGNFSPDSGCSSSINSTSIISGSSAVVVYYRATVAGTHHVTAHSQDGRVSLGSTVTGVQAGMPTHIRVRGPLLQGTACRLVDFEAIDAYENTTNSDSSYSYTVTVFPVSGTAPVISNNADCSFPVSSVNITFSNGVSNSSGFYMAWPTGYTGSYFMLQAAGSGLVPLNLAIYFQ